jgi:hypothetical protein
LIGLTVPEAHRLLRAADLPLAEREHRMRWSRWRRAHQAAAKRGHLARRARRAPPPPRPVRIVAVPATARADDALWTRLQPLLPPQPPRGRPFTDHRRVLDGILWVMRTGHTWRELPGAYGPWETIHSRYRRWRDDGTWQRVLGILHPMPPSDEAPPQVSL